MSNNLKNIWKFELTRGHSDDPRKGACAMDAISWFEYGELDDHPNCVCPSIAVLVRVMNDNLNDKNRQKLIPYLPKLINTNQDSSVMLKRKLLLIKYSIENENMFFPKYRFRLNDQYYNFRSVKSMFKLLDQLLAIGDQNKSVDYAAWNKANISFEQAREYHGV